MTKILSDDIISDLEGKITEDTPTVQKMMNYAGDNSLAFGLGGKAKDISGQDLNNLSQRTGFYTGNNLTNAPFADAWYVTQIVYNNSNIVQIARTVYSNANIYQRIKSWENSTQSATWKPWAKIISNNQSGSVTTNMLADNAVTAAKADVKDIMDNAGSNTWLGGLRGRNIWENNTDLNSYPALSGFYCGLNGTNKPSNVGNDVRFFVEQGYLDDKFAYQVLRPAYAYGTFYVRMKRENVWGDWTQYKSSQEMLNQLYPVGSMYMSQTLDTPAKVAATLGGGTWVQSAVGRVIVGTDSSQSEFNSTSNTGGYKSVTLTGAQMPSHYHDIVGLWAGGSGSGSKTVITGYPVSNKAGEYNRGTGNTGGGEAHTNLQPYIVRHVYTRTA